MSRKLYSCYWVRCEVLPGKWKEILHILFWKHDHKCVAEWFLNSKKASEVWKSWDLSRSHDIICGGSSKKLRRFRTICHVWCLRPEVSHKKNRSIEKDSVRFGVKVMIELGLTLKLFIYAIENIDWFLCNFGIFWVRLVIVIY